MDLKILVKEIMLNCLSIKLLDSKSHNSWYENSFMMLLYLILYTVYVIYQEIRVFAYLRHFQSSAKTSFLSFLLIFLKVDWYFVFKETLSNTANKVPSKVNMFSAKNSEFSAQSPQKLVETSFEVILDVSFSEKMSLYTPYCHYDKHRL